MLSQRVYAVSSLRVLGSEFLWLNLLTISMCYLSCWGDYVFYVAEATFASSREAHPELQLAQTQPCPYLEVI